MQQLGFEIIKSLIYLIPQLAIVFICIYYLVKRRTVDSILLTIATFIGLCTTLFFRVVIPMMSVSDFADRRVLIELFTFVGFIGSVVFAVGLILLIVKVIKLDKNS